MEFLRAFCALEVFVLHYLSPRYGAESTSWFCGAVPTFLLMSAYLYGTREPQPVYGAKFFRKRWLSLSVTYYPFILCTFAAFLMLGKYPVVQLVRGLAVDVFYLGGIRLDWNLPACGHLWFMTTLLLCYLVLVAVGNRDGVRRWFRSAKGVVCTFVGVILIGFVYRGGQTVHLFAYTLLFFNADRLMLLVSTRRRMLASLAVALVCYALVVMQMKDWFHYAIYLQYMVTCLIAVVTIAFAERFLARVSPLRCVTFLSDISMEIYLVHHLFVYDQPLYVSAPLTLVLSVTLHQVGKRLKRAVM